MFRYAGQAVGGPLMSNVRAHKDMPITPFHFGPGAAIHVVAPRQLSFLAFCAANVLIDIEPMYYMLTAQERLHRFFHTYIGATVVAIGKCAAFFALRGFARKSGLPNPFD
jgi:hypothetical protein